jgi:hypothetical protein
MVLQVTALLKLMVAPVKLLAEPASVTVPSETALPVFTVSPILNVPVLALLL